MMKRKLLSVLLCGVLAISMLGGCGDSEKEDTDTSKTSGDSSAADDGEKKELNIFISSPEYADAMNALIDEYKTVAPNITINYETTQNDYPTLLKAKLNSGDVPDIFASTSGKEIEVYKEYSYDLSDQPLMDTILPAVADTMKDGNGEGMYGIAIKGNYFGMVYNKALFQEAGIEKVPETMDELENAVEKLKNAGITPFTGGFSEWWVFKHVFQHYAAAAVDDYQEFAVNMEKGEDSLNNYPEIKDNFFQLIDLAKENGDAKPLEADLSAEIAAFASGKAAMVLGQGAWIESDVLAIDPNIEIGFAGYPVSDQAGDAKVITGSDQALRINKDSKNLDAVLDFINWWYTSDYGKAWFTDVAGVVPPITTEKESEFEIIKQGNASVEEKGSAALGVIYSTDSFHTAFGEAMQSYVTGDASKEDTIKTIEEKWIQIDGSTTN